MENPDPIEERAEITESNSGQRAMVRRKTWQEFREVGLLWWVNRVLHLLGWAIVFVQEEDGSISDVYPARCRFRGFSEKSETEGFRKVTRFLHVNADSLMEEAEE